MKSILSLVFIVLIIIIGGILVWAEKSSKEEEPAPEARITSFEECVAAGNPAMESWPRQCRAGDETFTEDIGNEFEKTDLIRSTTPRPNQTITSPLEISGEARGTWFFEASFPVKIIDGNGRVLLNSFVGTEDDWMTEDFVAYAGTLDFPTPTTKKGTLLLEKNNPSGIPEYDDALRIPVRFEQERITVQVYFNKGDSDDCREVVPVEREIMRTELVGRAALAALLLGPTEEKTEGYASNIPEGTRIQSLTIEEGTAFVDFNEILESGGGSCSMAARHAQIEETLKQLPTVDEVVISINGEAEDILQP